MRYLALIPWASESQSSNDDGSSKDSFVTDRWRMVDDGCDCDARRVSVFGLEAAFGCSVAVVAAAAVTVCC